MSALLDRALAPLRAHPTLKPGDRIVAAMSGGVDSSVMAALLHRAGYEVLGVSMQLFDKTKQGLDAEGRCCTLDDFQDARRVAFEQGFPHYVVDFEDRFRETVIDAFIEGYLAGETPSPCIRCNQHVKFRTLLERADALGAAFVATGHYADIRFDGRWRLHKAADPAKDQSYFLFNHTQETLARTLFPLAHLTKPEVRELGRELGLHLAEKAESQEVCFVPARYDAFIDAEGRAPGVGRGEIRHLDGRLLGEHEGYWRYTVGQRKGLGVSHAAPLYVVRVVRATNTVWVAEDAELEGLELIARELSWCGPAPTGPLPCAARIRSRSLEAEALVIPLEDGRAKVAFLEAQRAIAPGQAVVFYRDDEVLGGGWIDQD
ncbi:MAG TPA: tRNA 2-thiouridine(34) synthase MnmA [Holophagaceae bacterium]|nr:tRNA 2-thiouridine(34) synthase MnmA [Holophagaceae bacterium]